MLPKNVDQSWKSLFLQEQHTLETIRKTLSSNICPKPELVFRAFFSPLDSVRVVIMLLSPYNYRKSGIDYATGLATAVPDKSFITPTLRIMLESLWQYCHNIAIEDSFDFTLESWEKQGVMMTNAALTTPYQGDPRRHLDLWKPFTHAFVEYMSKRDVVMAFLGNDAKEFAYLVDDPITACHPVATAREYTTNGMNWDKIPEHLNFMKYNVFKRIDERIKKTYKLG